MGYLHNPYYYGGNFNVNVFTQTADATVGNTTTETSTIGDGVGSLTLFPNFFREGRSVDIRSSGRISGVNGDTGTLRIYVGGVKIVESVASMPATFSNTEFEFRFTVTCRGNNLFIGQGSSIILAGVGLTASYHRALAMASEATIDTTQEISLDSTYQWGTANEGNTITVTNCIINTIK